MQRYQPLYRAPVDERPRDRASLFEETARALAALIADARDQGLTVQEAERMLYDVLARQGGGGLGVRIHGLDSTQIAALKDFFHGATGLNPVILAESEIYSRSGRRLVR